jgi:c-di-GMP-binding flagellar brake protein YcgR
MLSKDINIGDKIEITLKGDKSRIIVHMSQIMDIIDENKLICALPIFSGSLVKMSLNIDYFFLMFTSNGMIRYEAKIVKIYKDGNLNLMNVLIESDGEREQRRSHYRLNRNLPVKFSTMIEDGANFESIVEMYDGVTKDISGNGIRFVANDKMPSGAKFRCVLLIDDEPFIAIAKLLYTANIRSSTHKYQYRAEFLSILPNEQERLIKYIFNEQLTQASRKVGQKLI